MSLFTQEDLIAAIPDAEILMAMDDEVNHDTTDEVFDSILADAVRWVNGYLEQAGLAMPEPPPSRLKHCGIKYAEYALHRRRSNSAKAKEIYEEWIKPAMHWLERIATGQESLLPKETDTPGGIVSEPSRTHSHGRLMA